MIRTKNELIIDQRTEEQKLRDENRAMEIANVGLQFDHRKNQKVSIGVSEDTKNLITTMAELAHMSISEFLRYLVKKEHHRLITDVRDGIPIEAETEEDRKRIFDQVMRAVQ